MRISEPTIQLPSAAATATAHAAQDAKDEDEGEQAHQQGSEKKKGGLLGFAKKK